MKLFVSYNANPLIQNYNGDTAFHLALQSFAQGEKSQMDIIKVMMKNLDVEDIVAIENKKKKTVIHLIKEYWFGGTVITNELISLFSTNSTIKKESEDEL